MEMEPIYKKTAVAIVAITVVALILVFVLHKPTSPSCELIAATPVFDAKTLKTTHSSDKKALVSFEGYLVYLQRAGDKPLANNVMPLSFDSVSLVTADKNRNLTLATNCSTIVFQVAADSTVSYGSVSLTVPNGNATECAFNPKLAPARGMHYRCLKDVAYPCHSLDPKATGQVAALHVQALEFELDGKAEDVDQNKFSTGADECRLK